MLEYYQVKSHCAIHDRSGFKILCKHQVLIIQTKCVQGGLLFYTADMFFRLFMLHVGFEVHSRWLFVESESKTRHWKSEWKELKWVVSLGLFPDKSIPHSPFWQKCMEKYPNLESKQLVGTTFSMAIVTSQFHNLTVICVVIINVQMVIISFEVKLNSSVNLSDSLK